MKNIQHCKTCGGAYSPKQVKRQYGPFLDGFCSSSCYAISLTKRDKRPTNDGQKVLEELGVDVHSVAEQIFDECGAADDFGHQTGLVFGGTNRIVLTSLGWRADRSVCTPGFLEAFDKYMAKGQ